MDSTSKPELTSRENFIPLRKAELVDLLLGEPGLGQAQQSQFRQLARILEATFHFEYHQQLEDLKDKYAPFDPDADTQRIAEISHADREARAEGVFEQFIWLLERANFRRLSRVEIEAAVEAFSEWGLNLQIDFGLFQQLEVFARGNFMGCRIRRRWQNYFRPEPLEVPTYQRLALVFRLHAHSRQDDHSGPQSIYLKLFKNIPHVDLDMLLPGSRVKMSMLDRSKIILPTLTGLGITIWKLVSGAVVLAVAGIYGLLALLGVVGGTVGYGVRSFFGYLRTKQKYQLSLTERLYYKSLDNNAGVLFRLLDEAEEQEAREALLAYFFLWRDAGAGGWSSEELDRHIEQFLRDKLKSEIDFEVGDALAKLERLGLIEVAEPGRLRALPIDRALATLDAAWDNFFPYSKANQPPAPHWDRVAAATRPS